MQLHTLNGHIQSIYLVEYSDKLMLLDGCCRADCDLVAHFITSELNRPLSDLKLIVVTHMHPDHAGGAHKLRAITGAKIATSNAPGHWYQGFDGIMMHITDILLARWVASRKGKKQGFMWYSRKLKADIYLPDGVSVPNFDEWQVHHSPGHTDRDICLHHLPSNMLYVADLMVKVKGKLIPPFPVFYPKRYLNSLLMLKTLKPDSLLLAHDGKIKFSEIDFNSLLQKAPSIPMTHWRSVKSKLQQVFKSPKGY